VPLVLVDLFPSRFYAVMGTASYLVFHNVTEFFGVMVAFSIFGVGWYTHGQSRDRHALFLGCAFLAIGLMDFMHTLSYAGMPDLLTPSSPNKASTFWVAVRSFAAVAFLASAFVRADSPSRWLTRPVLGTVAVVVPAVVFAAVVFFPSQLPAMFVPGVGQTPVKRGAEYVIVAVLVAAILAHGRRFAHRPDPSAALYVAAFALSAFSELFFAAYTSVTDTRNALGHVYKVVAFYLVYRGVFIASVQRPHRQLQDTAEALRREVAERATVEQALARSAEERRRVEEQLQQAQKIEAVGRLAGGIAHDFNNLLTAILGANQQLLEQLPPSSRLREDAREIDLAARKAATLTRQLLTFSRRQVVAPRVVALDELLGGLVPVLRRLIGETVDLEVRVPAGLGRVRIDPGQLEQVVVNLVVNGRDALVGGGRVTVEAADVVIDAREARQQAGVRPGRFVMLAVSDTGRGMDAGVLSHLFEPFFTTKEPGKGTGLGLSTLYGIVKQAGGHIRVESEVGVGSVFRVYLPHATGEAEGAEGATGQVAQAEPGIVLLVEDDPQVRAVVLKVLRRAGHTVLDAADGEEALERASDPAQPIDVLLTDVVMPRLGGRELAARIRLTRPDLKVLFISGYVEQGFAPDELDEATRFLQKPFTPAALEAELSSLLADPRLRAVGGP
jgi:signal transduction histidine kinase/CheY-like chemotaxis protein